MSVVGNEAGQGRPASGRRFERRQGWHSEIKRAAPPGCQAAVEQGMRLGGGESAWIESAGVDQPAAGFDDNGLVVGQGFDQFKTALPAQHKYARR